MFITLSVKLHAFAVLPPDDAFGAVETQRVEQLLDAGRLLRTEAAALVGEEPLFSKGYWKCASGCKPFGFGLARTPRECPSCHKQLILWVPGP